MPLQSPPSRTATAVPDPVEPTVASRFLGENEIRDVLRRTGWGVLATDDGGQPYAVPVSYGFDGSALFLASGPGRKLSAMERNPRVCLTVAHVIGLDAWTSVVLTGEVRWLESLPERARALVALARQRRAGSGLGVRDTRRLLTARLARLEIDSMTGRRSHPPEGRSA